MRTNGNGPRAGYCVGLALALSLAALAVDKVQPLNVKIGLWEVTTNTTKVEDIVIPAGLLERLTPEQHARLEERMRARPSDPPRVTMRNYCLTKEQLEKGVSFGVNRKSCISKVVHSTGNRLEMRMECGIQGQGIKSAGELEIEALDTEKVKGLVRLTIVGDRAAASSSTFTARWIGPVCK